MTSTILHWHRRLVFSTAKERLPSHALTDGQGCLKVNVSVVVRARVLHERVERYVFCQRYVCFMRLNVVW